MHPIGYTWRVFAASKLALRKRSVESLGRRHGPAYVPPLAAIVVGRPAAEWSLQSEDEQKMSTRISTPAFQILRLRLLVAFLGERAQFGWWPTEFYGPSARLFLEPIFAKAGHLAQYHGVIEAARRHHNEALSVSAFHLFHLPEEVEQDLHKLLQDDASPSGEYARYESAQSALEALLDLSDGRMRAAVGPAAIGQVSDLEKHLGDIAAIYASAFGSGTQATPYLVREL